MIESPWYGDLRPVSESQSDSEDWALLIVRARHQNILKLWGLVDNTERLCAGPHFRTHHQARFHTQRVQTHVVCLDSAFSLEFPSVECSSAFYSSWFFPTDWSARAEGGNIMFYSNHCDSFKQWTPRLHFRCSPCLHPSPFSRLKWYLPAYYSNSFRSSASTDKAADPLGSKSVHLRMASFHSRPRWLCPTVFSPFTGRIWWVLPQPQIQQATPPPFAFQIPLPILHPRLTQRQARQLESCLSFCWAFVIITITV